MMPGKDAAAPRVAREAHNQLQRAYCEDAISDTIRPRESRHITRQLEQVMRVAAVSAEDRVLEVGCGMGRFTLRLAARGVRIEGLDLSPVLLDRFRALNAGRFEIPLHCADLVTPPPHLLDQFDLVVGFFVLHHVKDVGEAVGAMSRMLKPGGRLVLLDANGYNPLFYVQVLGTPGMTWEGDKGITRMRPGFVFRALERVGMGRFKLTRFGAFPAFVADRTWGARMDAALDRIPLPGMCRAFQIFLAHRV
jgi:SAM-dependent methyltransferase